MEDVSKDILKRYLDHHNMMIDKVGFNPLALYTTSASQIKRFREFEKLFHSKENFSLLDVGCGFSDFFAYLLGNDYKDLRFTGIDINEKMTGESQRRFPESTFITGTVEALPESETYDYAVASGVYNLGKSQEEVQDFFLEQFRVIAPKVNIGFAVNFLSAYTDKPDGVSIYHNPSMVLDKIMKEFGKYCILSHDYLPHDFTVFVWKKMRD